MLIRLLPYTVTCISFFMLAFIAIVNPMRVNVAANRWFGFFLFSAASLFLNNLIYYSDLALQYSRLIAFNELSRFVMMPALYLSVLHFTSPNKVVKKVEWLHFIPFLLFFVCMAPFVVLNHSAFSSFKVLPTVNRVLGKLVFTFEKVQTVTYWLLAYYKLYRHQNNIKLITSDTVPVNLHWLKYMLLGIVFMIILALSQLFFNMGILTIYITYGYLIGVCCICYFLLAQKEIYPYEPFALIEVEAIISEPPIKGDKQRLSSEQANQLKEKLERLMYTDKIFLDNELSLPGLAQRMNMSGHDLSYLLNDKIGVNFFQYINSYRVDEAKQLMLSDKHKHLNILGIAYSAGFNSKTTFNTAFKKQTGVSPSQFVQQAKNGLAQAIYR